MYFLSFLPRYIVAPRILTTCTFYAKSFVHLLTCTCTCSNIYYNIFLVWRLDLGIFAIKSTICLWFTVCIIMKYSFYFTHLYFTTHKLQRAAVLSQLYFYPSLQQGSVHGGRQRAQPCLKRVYDPFLSHCCPHQLRGWVRKWLCCVNELMNLSDTRNNESWISIMSASVWLYFVWSHLFCSSGLPWWWSHGPLRTGIWQGVQTECSVYGQSLQISHDTLGQSHSLQAGERQWIHWLLVKVKQPLYMYIHVFVHV